MLLDGKTDFCERTLNSELRTYTQARAKVGSKLTHFSGTTK